MAAIDPMVFESLRRKKAAAERELQRVQDSSHEAVKAGNFDTLVAIAGQAQQVQTRLTCLQQELDMVERVRDDSPPSAACLAVVTRELQSAGPDIVGELVNPKAELVVMQQRLQHVEAHAAYLQNRLDFTERALQQQAAALRRLQVPFGLRFTPEEASLLAPRTQGEARETVPLGSPAARAIQRIMNDTILDVHYTSQFYPYSKIEVLEVTSLFNPTLLRTYLANRTAEETEVFALHGTLKSRCDSIAHEGFRPSKRGSFGSGIYLTENASVANLFTGSFHSVPRTSNMLVCVVAIGAFREREFSIEVPDLEYKECTFGEDNRVRRYPVTPARLCSQSALLGRVPGKYTEAVVYDSWRVYPLFEVAYRPLIPGLTCGLREEDRFVQYISWACGIDKLPSDLDDARIEELSFQVRENHHWCLVRYQGQLILVLKPNSFLPLKDCYKRSFFGIPVIVEPFVLRLVQWAVIMRRQKSVADLLRRQPAEVGTLNPSLKELALPILVSHEGLRELPEDEREAVEEETAKNFHLCNEEFNWRELPADLHKFFE
eukprot:TRINITY_DN29664_c0_g1_i1.p1 TRINITY_DN29664_c0_g1~~TRINITY_DN29664_c0_g1_i1.p1  ORF type:complete len:554 (-),score=101.12 TRINITY_DN29664_c0_g1_i1:159-1799(-)